MNSEPALIKAGRSKFATIFKNTFENPLKTKALAKMYG
jgi:hypothetical protein